MRVPVSGPGCTSFICSSKEQMNTGRRQWLRGAAAASLAAAAPLAVRAQAPSDWPAKPLQLIVPWPAGGATDLTLRVLCEEAKPLLGEPIVIINKPGAAGTQVANLLKQAEPDGYTIGQMPITVYRYALMNKVAWNPLKDFSPILQVAGTTFGLLVPADSAWKTFDDMLQWAKAHQGELLLGSTGIGTTAHLAMEEILLKNQIKYVHVPYKGTTDQMLAIATKQIMAGVNSTGFTPWLEQGKMRLLATFSAARNPRWPQVPTMHELGYPDAVYTSPWGIAAPAGTPTAIIQKLQSALARAVHTPRHLQELARFEQDLEYLDTADYAKALRASVAHECKLLDRMHLLSQTCPVPTT